LKFRVLIGLCVVAVAVACIVFSSLPEPRNWEAARWATLFSYTAAVMGAGFGAFAFGRGDRLRWAWLLLASYAIIGVGKVALWGSPRHVGPPLGFLPQTQTALANGVSTILLNVASVTGLALFARVWHGTGLTPPWRGRATLAAFALAITVAAVPVWRDIHMIMTGQTIRVGGLVSSFGDIASITLIGPVLVTAIAMRGGLLVWPWTVLTTSCVAWLCFDAVQLVPVSQQPVCDLATVMFATLTTGAAGVAHRWAVGEHAVPAAEKAAA
jgi:hypothetical protein